MIITCRRSHLEERCRQRGYSFSSVLGCVVSVAGDIWAIDTDHADYPVERVGALGFKCVPDCTDSQFLCGAGQCCVENGDGTNSCVQCSSSSGSNSSSTSGSSSSAVSSSSSVSGSSSTANFGFCEFSRQATGPGGSLVWGGDVGNTPETNSCLPGYCCDDPYNACGEPVVSGASYCTVSCVPCPGSSSSSSSGASSSSSVSPPASSSSADPVGSCCFDCFVGGCSCTAGMTQSACSLYTDSFWTSDTTCACVPPPTSSSSSVASSSSSSLVSSSSSSSSSSAEYCVPYWQSSGIPFWQENYGSLAECQANECYMGDPHCLWCVEPGSGQGYSPCN